MPEPITLTRHTRRPPGLLQRLIRFAQVFTSLARRRTVRRGRPARRHVA